MGVVSQWMLSWKWEASWSHSNSTKNLSWCLKLCYCYLQFSNIVFINISMACQVASIQEVGKTLHHFSQYMPQDSSQVYLWMLKTWGMWHLPVRLFIYTFINAFKSSPVHCLNCLPWENYWSAGNASAAAILLYLVLSLACIQYFMITYQRSISSNIALAHIFSWVRCR